MKSDDAEKRTISLPADLYRRTLEAASACGYDSVEEYVISVLKEVLDRGGEATLSPEEEQEVKRRLKDLGYLS